MKTKFLILMAAFALATPALAADVQTPAAVETFNVDASHASVGFQVRHLMSQVTGKFTGFEGTVDINREDPSTSKVEFTIKADTIDTANEKRDGHLKNADFFDVEKYPTITFTSTAVKAVENDTYHVTGDFTMHGVTKSIVLPVKVLGEMKDPWGNQRIGFEINTTLNRKDYGISYNKVLDQGGLMLGEEVKIAINLEAVKAQ